MKGQRYMTVSMTENQVLNIEYDYRCAVDILNDCDAEIYVSAENDFKDFLKIPSGCCYNGFMSSFDDNNIIYIKAAGSGDVSIGVAMS